MVELAKKNSSSSHRRKAFTWAHWRFNTYAEFEEGHHKLLIHISRRIHSAAKVGEICVQDFSPAWACDTCMVRAPGCCALKLSLLLLLISSSSTQHQPSTPLPHVRDSSRRRLLPSTTLHFHHLEAFFRALLGATRHSGPPTRRKFLHLHRPSVCITSTSPQWPTRQSHQLQ